MPFLTATAAARSARDEHHQINVRCIGANWKSAVLEKRRAFSPNYERLKKKKGKNRRNSCEKRVKNPVRILKIQALPATVKYAC